MGLNAGYMKSPPGILKVVEIIFVIIAFSIFRGGNASFGNINSDFFACGVLVTALIITPLLLVCYLMGKTEIQKTILEMALNFLLFTFLLSAGSVGISWAKDLIEAKHLKNLSLTMGSFCLLASFAYFGDFILSVLKFRGGDDH